MLNFNQIAAIKAIQTPFYYYDMALLNDTLQQLGALQEQHRVKLHYALKANANLPILRAIGAAGLGADCVSGNEIDRALEAGISPSDIVFAGVGKTAAEINLGIHHQISCFNVESLHELDIINEISKNRGYQAPVAFRINPDLDGGTHRHITTGTRTDKFGLPVSDIPELISSLRRMEGIRFKGLHFHIGSQITSMQIFTTLATRVNEIQRPFIEAGVPPPVINLGGGLGIDYTSPDQAPAPDFDSYFKACLDRFNRLPGQEVYFEPGRSVVANCGSLFTQVLYLKNNGAIRFAVVDAGMNDLIRPALYQAQHKIQLLGRMGMEQEYQVVGPVCESSDVFGKEVSLPELQRGDLLAIRSAGAYGQSMASGYNLRPPAQAIYSDAMTISRQPVKIS